MAAKKAKPTHAYRYVGGPEDDRPLPDITIGKKTVRPGDVLPASAKLDADPRFLRIRDPGT